MMRYVLATLLCLPTVYAQAIIALSPSASPSSAQPGVTVVAVIGSGFPSGSIPAANVTVTITLGKGHSGGVQVTPIAVQPLFGTTDRITFQVPSSTTVKKPVPSQIAVSGTTSTGVLFASGNNASFTVDPLPSIASVSPGMGNAGVNLQVTINATYTTFVQGATQANFGPGVSVGGAVAGQPGPMTVISPTSATAQLAIDPSAATGSRSITILTASQQAQSTFTVEPVIVVTNIDLTTTTPISPGVSGFNDEPLIHGVEYWDPKFLPYVISMKPGWLRFPGGTPDMVFNWQTGHVVPSWVQEVAQKVSNSEAALLVRDGELTQAKGGVYLSDYATYLRTVGAWSILDLNAYTDNNPGSANNEVMAAQSLGIDVHEYELGNEAWYYPKFYPTATAYASAVYNLLYLGVVSANPNAVTGVDYTGQFSGPKPTAGVWDMALKNYSPQYWNAAAIHVYPITASKLTTLETEERLNAVLAWGTTVNLQTYLIPVLGDTPIFISEINDGHAANGPFKSSLYNGIYLAEYTARMSTSPQVKAIGMANLFEGDNGSSSAIRTPDDYNTYLINQVKKNPNYSTDTATNPKTQFTFYYSTPGLAMQVVNPAINGSSQIWPTTVTGGPTVPITGYDGQPIPAVFAQAYNGNDGTHYVVLTNKSGVAVPVAIEVNGSLLEQTLNVTSVSNADPLAQNTNSDQNHVQAVTGTSANPILMGPYCVMRVQW